MHADLLVVNGIAVLPRLGTHPVAIAVTGGRIAAVLADARGVDADEVVDAAGCYVLPGRIEPHAHFGYGSMTEDFYTETRAAAAGGVTSVLTYWRQQVPYRTLIPESLEAARTRVLVDYGFHLGLLIETHLDELPMLVEEYGITSFKMYMGYKGAEGASLGLVGCDDGYLYEGMRRLAPYRDAVISVHAENAEIIARLRPQVEATGRADLSAWTDSRPAFTEIENAMRAVYFAQVTGCPVQIAHISAAGVLDVVRAGRARGVQVYAETCPHYLVFTRDASIGVLGKVNPPLRTEADTRALWEALASGTMDTVGSDHAVITRRQKQGNLWTAATGVGQGLGTVYPVLYTYGVQTGHLTIERMAEVTSEAVARVFGLYPRKGAIAPGSDADLVILDPKVQQAVTPEVLQSAADFSIYEGLRLTGWPVMTIVRGQVVMREGVVMGQPGSGQYLERTASRAHAGREARDEAHPRH